MTVQHVVSHALSLIEQGLGVRFSGEQAAKAQEIEEKVCQQPHHPYVVAAAVAKHSGLLFVDPRIAQARGHC